MSLFKPRRRYSNQISEDTIDTTTTDDANYGDNIIYISTHPMDEVIYLDTNSKELSATASASAPYLKVAVTPILNHYNRNSLDESEDSTHNNNGSSSGAATAATATATPSTPNKNGNRNGEEADSAAGVTNTTTPMTPMTPTGAAGLLQRVSSSLSLSLSIGGGGDQTTKSNSNTANANANANVNVNANNAHNNTCQHSHQGGGGMDSSTAITTTTGGYGDGIDISMAILNRNHRNYCHRHQHSIMNPERSIGNKYGINLPNSIPVIPSWRLRDRMKTAGIGLIMALNVGTDPPDIIKPYPCAKLQCWMDPLSVSRAKAKEKIGDRLEKQYSKFLQQSQRGGSSSTSNNNTSNNTSNSSTQQQQSQSSSQSNKNPFKYRKALDPTVEDVRGLCLWLRKQARTERILLHYNGHGVPRPTPNGEIWVFDKNHTEYIPLSVSDLRQWVGKPTIVILDCSSAGILIPFLTAPQTETPAHSPIMTSMNSNTNSNNNTTSNGNNTMNYSSAATSTFLRGSGSVGGNLSNLGNVMSSPNGGGGGKSGIRISSGADQLKLMQQAAHTAQAERQAQQQQPNFNTSHNTLDDDDPIITNMDTAASYWVKDTIVLCPTSEGEWLPMNPEYPADIFTSCLTTPIPIALRWFIRQNSISMSNLQIDPDFNVDSIPGQPNDRKTPLGELNWIFTSVTDSIAWNVLPKPLFQRLFRQDLLVASMFRNFLLADRILRSLNCTPQSYPPLPEGVADHPLWLAWDLACETCLFNLIQDGILGNNKDGNNNNNTNINSDTTGTAGTAGTAPNTSSGLNISSKNSRGQHQRQPLPGQQQQPEQHQQQHAHHHHHHRQQQQHQGQGQVVDNTSSGHYTHSTHSYHLASSVSSPFFSEQLTAFEVWLEYAAIHKGNANHLQPPEQLPVVLQVLLSQVHRVRALELLKRFLELGPWAVNLALSLGIFPYVIKLLQSAEYKTVLVNIWSSILKFDPSCQVDLVKDKSLVHFIQPLTQWAKQSGGGGGISNNTNIVEAAKQRTLIAFCLAATCNKYPNAQSECLRQNLHGSCAELLTAEIKLHQQQRRQEQEEEHKHSHNRRASNDASRFQLLSPIAREWICMCIGNLVRSFHLGQTQAYNTNVHLCLIALQQDDDNANVRAAATYALSNLLSHIPPPPTSSIPSSLGPTSSSSSSSSRRAQMMHPSSSTPSIRSPTPISLGPQAFANTRGIRGIGGPPPSAAAPPFQPGLGGVLPGQQHQQMFLPNHTGMPTPIVPVQTVLPTTANGLSSGHQLQPSNNISNTNPGGPATAALAAAMSRGGPTNSIPNNNPGGPATAALASVMAQGGLAPTQQELQLLQQSIPQGKEHHQQQQQHQQVTRGAPMLSSHAFLSQGGLLHQQQSHQVPAITPQHPVAGGGSTGALIAGTGGQNFGPIPQQTSLTRATSGPQIGATVAGNTAMNPQGTLFHPQRTPMTGAPIEMPPIGSPLGRGFSPSFSGQQPQQQLRRRPTVYEDRRRIEFDLKVIESMIKVLADGSPMVRYEVIMGLSNFVEKYLQAILVVAEDATRVVDVIERLGNIQEEQHGDDNYNNESNTAHSIESRKRVVSLPRGVNQMNMERFEKCWKALRVIQHDDPHPNVSEAANVIVRVVHETFYDMRMEKEAKIRDMIKSDHGLSGIQEEGEVGGGGEGIDRVKSVSNISMGSPDFKRNVNIFSPKTMPRSDGPSHRLPKTNLYPLRRSSSEAGGGNFPSSNVGDETRNIPAMPDRNLIDRVKAENLLPKSEFYKWKKSIFRPDYDDVDLEDRDDRDPLNPLGAARNYQNRRNKIVRREGLNIAHHFVGLKPQSESQRRDYDMILNDNDDEEKDEKDAFLRSELKLREKQILRNTGGVKMTSMLKFHSYENALVVCDNEDFVSIWDYENGVRKSSFTNGNPSGSRMTTAFWINESSTSLLFVGCDDGSARIWNGIVENNGQISGQAPTLASSFFAIPDMEPGQRSSSGLICEWQQTTGTLIAGGNSRHLRCWDMTAEKCSTSIDIDTNSCITALTTAWDEDEAYSAVHNSNGFRGTGPEIIVAGLSDGTLKLFDIRTPKTGAVLTTEATRGKRSATTATTGGTRTRRPAAAMLNNKTFNEHGSWIVDVSFSSFGSSGGSQNEILSGSVAGDIRAWDIRSSSRSSLRAIEVQRSPMTALSVHKKIPIAATGSHAQFIKILTLEGETLQVARFHENSLPGHRIGPVSCLEFHKHKLVLAAGSTNALVSIYQPRRP